ncbi:MAG: hypothetical protein QOE58_930, partial [Actinomycetota bacterium]|nr:hypothetical protein [Actinomycetota bacterium]
VPDVSDRPEHACAQGRAEAERITERWAATLLPAQQRRFHTQQEAVPRQRATAGIHALLDAGWTPADLAAELTQHPMSEDGQARTGDIRAGAAVLDHRAWCLARQGLQFGAVVGLVRYWDPSTRTIDWWPMGRPFGHFAEVPADLA